MSIFPSPLTEIEAAACEAYADVFGIPALLDRLGLDGLGNEINAAIASTSRGVEALLAGLEVGSLAELKRLVDLGRSDGRA